MTTVADITLNALGYDARELASRAETMARHATFLGAIPSFPTAAEADLERAERVIKSALETVRNVRANIRPVPKLQATG